MKLQPQFSIIIPALNEEHFLPLLLQDLTHQTYTNFEVILVDAHSTDQTVTKAKSFQSELNLTITQSQQRNVAHQRNQGAHQARAHTLIFLDADDRLPQHYLKDLHHQLSRHGSDFFTTYMHPNFKSLISIIVSFGNNLRIELQKNRSLPCVRETMFGCRREVFLNLNGFKENINFAEGEELLFRAKKAGYTFTVFKHPRYITSMRRVYTTGIIKSALFELNNLLHFKGAPPNAAEKYPMHGGSQYTKVKLDKDSTATLPKKSRLVQ